MYVHYLHSAWFLDDRTSILVKLITKPASHLCAMCDKSLTTALSQNYYCNRVSQFSFNGL